MAMLIIPTDEELWKQGYGGDVRDEAMWGETDDGKMETFGSARARFATFGPLLNAEEALRYAEQTGHAVMSFGYGEDPENFDGIEAEELKDSIEDDGALATMSDWGPFAPWLGVNGDDTPRDHVDHLAGRHNEVSDLECQLCRDLYRDEWLNQHEPEVTD